MTQRTSSDRFLVTGAMGCIGSWTVKCLIDEGADVVGFDVSDDPRRLRLITADSDVARVTWRKGDLRDAAAIRALIAELGITHVIHLAALQVPMCRADPVLGAQVNVTGTVNVFEAVLANRRQVRGFAYASSGAVFGPPSMYPDGVVADDSALRPNNLYGVYKQANEATARIYAQDHELYSVGLRPFVAYGVGRDQGFTAQPSLAMAAAAAGRSFTISHAGSMFFQFAADLGRVFVRAVRVEARAAMVLNVGGHRASIPEFIGMVTAAAPEAEGRITYEGAAFDGVSSVDSSGLDNLIRPFAYTPLGVGIDRSMRLFKDLVDRGMTLAAS